MAATRPRRAAFGTWIRNMAHYLFLILLFVVTAHSNDTAERPTNCLLNCADLNRSNPPLGCATTPEQCGDCIDKYRQDRRNSTICELDTVESEETPGVSEDYEAGSSLYAVIGVVVLVCILLLIGSGTVYKKTVLDGRKRRREGGVEGAGEEDEDEGETIAKRFQRATGGKRDAGSHDDPSSAVRVPLVPVPRSRKEPDSESEPDEPVPGPSGVTAPPVDSVDTTLQSLAVVHTTRPELPYVLPPSQADSIPLGFEELDGGQAHGPKTEEDRPTRDPYWAQRFSDMAGEQEGQGAECFHLEEAERRGGEAGQGPPATTTEPMTGPIFAAGAVNQVQPQPEMDVDSDEGEGDDEEMDEDLASEDSGTESRDESRVVPEPNREESREDYLRRLVGRSQADAEVPETQSRIITLPELVDEVSNNQEQPAHVGLVGGNMNPIGQLDNLEIPMAQNLEVVNELLVNDDDDDEDNPVDQEASLFSSPDPPYLPANHDAADNLNEGVNPAVDHDHREPPFVPLLMPINGAVDPTDRFPGSMDDTIADLPLHFPDLRGADDQKSRSE